jgi:hypothetical protein
MGFLPLKETNFDKIGKNPHIFANLFFTAANKYKNKCTACIDGKCKFSFLKQDLRRRLA